MEKEKMPIQKEFGEIRRFGNTIQIKKMGLSTKEQGEDDDVVGEALLEKMDEPIPHYYLDDIYISRDEQGKGFGSQLMQEVEKLSRETNMPIVLEDAIDPDDELQREYQNKEAVGMYGKRAGWVMIENHKYVFGATDPNVFLYT